MNYNQTLSKTFGIVILHYKTLPETVACVHSVKENFSAQTYHIVIVDNGSGNNTGEALLDMYQEDPAVSVLLNKDNLGFARGLNVGIDYLNRSIDPDFILLLNNDTVLLSPCWAQTIEQKFEEYQFAVMGPDIISLDDVHCNPAVAQIHTLADVHRLIRKKRRKIRLIKWQIYPVILRLKQIIKKLIRYVPATNTLYKTEHTGAQLQGSCLILSRKFFQHYDRLFDGTFLYFEEAILKYMCDQCSLVSLYCPELRLLHKDGVATRSTCQNQYTKQLFYLENSLYSCQVFLEWVKNEQATPTQR